MPLTNKILHITHNLLEKLSKKKYTKQNIPICNIPNLSYVFIPTCITSIQLFNRYNSIIQE